MSDNAHKIAAAAEPIKLAEIAQASSGTVNNSEDITAGNGSGMEDASNTKAPATDKSKRASGGIDNFRLGQKAVLLVSVPLIFQIAFATTLFTLLTQSRIEARKGQIANEVTLRTGALVEHMVEAGKALAVYGMAHQEAARDRFLKRLDMMPADLAAVDDLERRAPETKGSLEKIVSTSRLTMTYLTESERLFELGETKAGLNYMKRLQGVYEELTEYLETVRSEYNKVIKSVPKQQEKFGELIDLALLLSIPANVGLAVYLALRINKNVTRRLQVIMDNSRRLEQERELNEELTGSDEIADLDRVFHGVAASIRESAEALRKSESQIRALIEKMPVGVITLTPNGTIDSLNPEAENIFQVPSREVRGQSCVFLLEPDLSTEQLLGKLAALKRGALDARGVRSSGESFDARIMVNELSDTTGGLLLNVQDVSEQKAVERMKREFMQMVSHDLRTPLSSIRLTFEMFAEGYFGKLEENASRKVKAEREHCEQIINLVTELLELERIESSGKLKLALDHCDLYRVMFNAVGTIQNLATHKGLRINLIPCSIGLVADKVRIRQLIINLLSNAIKYSPNSGEVKIFAERIDAENICIRVEDEGRGIPVEMRTSIFERFKQVRDADRETGSGIGLAICKAIAEAHGGAVGVDAKPEGGSSFWVKLPAETDDDDDDIT